MKRSFILTIILLSTWFISSLKAADVVPIYENEIYVCAKKPGGKLTALCSGDPAIQGLEASLTFYQTKSGRIVPGEAPELFHTIEGKLIRNSIGASVYQFKDESGITLSSDTLVGVMMSLKKEGFKPYYSQIVPLRVFGLDSNWNLVFNRNDFNSEGFVSDAYRLIGRNTSKQISGAWMPDRFEPRYMQIHQVVPMHVVMEPIGMGAASPKSSKIFGKLYQINQ